jgi:hypothetical protein
MHKKFISFIFIIMCCLNSHIIFNDENHDDSTKLDIQKKQLAILEKELDELNDIQKKLVLSEKYTTNSNICFYLILASAFGAAVSFFRHKQGTPDLPILGSSMVIGGVATMTGLAVSYGQRCTLNNITEQKKAPVQAISTLTKNT